MATEKRLVYLSDVRRAILSADPRLSYIADRLKPVDAVEVPDEKLLKAIKLLVEQYEHSKNSEYVHHPVAHAFYHTWKQLDGRRK